MRLAELEPKFLRHESDTSHRRVETMAEADGVMFLCPTCFRKNNGPIGTHVVICWSPSVPQTTSPTGGRWPMTGTGLDDLTLTPSIMVPSDPPDAPESCWRPYRHDEWHGWITNGEVT